MLIAVLALTTVLASAAEDDPKEKARKLVNRGNQSFALADFEAALADYQAAYEAFPSPKILVNLGESHRALEQWAQAVLHYERFLRDAPQDDDMVAQVEARIAELEPKVGRLEIQNVAGDAEITVDGRALEGTRTVVEPGSHQVTVQRAGFHDFIRTVAVAAGETATVDTVMEKLAPAPPPDLTATAVPQEGEEDGSITGKWWFWAGTGAAAIAVVGVVLGVALNTGGDDFVPAGELPRVSTMDWERF